MTVNENAFINRYKNYEIKKTKERFTTPTWVLIAWVSLDIVTGFQ